MNIERKGEILEKKGTIGESLGVEFYRSAKKVYPWYSVPWVGIETAASYTSHIVYSWVVVGGWALGLNELPEGVDEEDVSVMGPVGIFALMGEFFEMGVDAFLKLVSLIAIALALVNILPIPALDGGKMVFLTFEAVRGRPVNYKIEQKINTAFFYLLIGLIIFITFRFDLPGLLNN